MERSAVEQALQHVLADAKFASSPQMTAFLAYVVEQTLDGKGDRIKAFSIGVDALGKPPTFNPQCDASVRVLAARLRKNIAAYNASQPPGAVIIRMHKGTYVPEFTVQTADAVVELHAHTHKHTQVSTVSTDQQHANASAAPLAASGSATASATASASSTTSHASDDAANAEGGGLHANQQSEPDNEDSLENLARGSRAPRVAVPVLGVGLLIGMMFAGSDKPTTVDWLSPMFALAQEEESLRPELPVVSILATDQDDPAVSQLSFTLAGVMGRFRHVDLRHTSTELSASSVHAGRAGHYTLALNVLRGDTRLIVGVQLVHTLDGEVVFVDSVDIGTTDIDIAAERLRDSVAMLVQREGALVAHFDAVAANLSEANCLLPALRDLDQRVSNPELPGSSPSATTCGGAGSGSGNGARLAEVARATIKAGEDADSIELGDSQTVALARDAVLREPHVAESYYALSIALLNAGTLDEATRQAENATNRNPYDIPMLLHHAQLADDLGQSSVAEHLRARARRIESAAVL